MFYHSNCNIVNVQLYLIIYSLFINDMNYIYILQIIQIMYVYTEWISLISASFIFVEKTYRDKIICIISKGSCNDATNFFSRSFCSKFSAIDIFLDGILYLFIRDPI